MALEKHIQQTEITFRVSSEIFSFNALIEDCRSFLISLGYTEISSMYIVLRELVFNTIINASNNDEKCVFGCTIRLMQADHFKVTLKNIKGCTRNRCFDWINRDQDDGPMDRGNTLLYNNINAIDIDMDNNTISVFVTLQKNQKGNV